MKNLINKIVISLISISLILGQSGIVRADNLITPVPTTIVIPTAPITPIVNPIMATPAVSQGWKQSGEIWNYLKPDGTKTIGWLQDNNKWYYLDSDGSMVTGWKQLGAIWYYLNLDGGMATGWKQLGTTWYYLNSTSGAMDTNTTVGGYYLGANGAMQNKPSNNGTSYIDEAMTTKLNAGQPWEHYAVSYPTNGKYNELVQACNNIVLGLAIPTSIQQPWNPTIFSSHGNFQYMGNSVNIVTGEKVAYYTRFKDVSGCGGYSHIVAYYDASIKGYKFYYITIGLYKM